MKKLDIITDATKYQNAISNAIDGKIVSVNYSVDNNIVVPEIWLEQMEETLLVMLKVKEKTTITKHVFYKPESTPNIVTVAVFLEYKSNEPT